MTAEEAPTVREETTARTPVTGVVVIDLAGVVLSWNEGATELFGYPPDEAVGRMVDELILPEPLGEAHRNGLAAYRTTGATKRLGATLDVPALRKDGATVRVEMSLVSVHVGPDELFLATFRRPLPAPTAIESLAIDLIADIFEHAPEAITILDRRGHQRVVNAVGARLLGYDDELRHQGDGTVFVHPDDLALVRTLGSRARPPGEPVMEPMRYRVVGANGQVRWLETLAADFHDRPEIQGLVAFSRDVTDDEERRRLLHESEARLRAIISRIGSATIVEDADGRAILANDRFASMVGARSGDELAGRNVSDLLVQLAGRTVEAEEVAERLRRAGQSPAGVDLGPMLLVDGRWIELETVPIGGAHEAVGRCWLFRDVTERVDAEQRLRRLLDREQRARELAEARTEQLRLLHEAREGFVSAVSHDFRTPLAAMISSTELLAATDLHGDELIARHLELMNRSARRLTRLVEDLLVIGRLGAGQVTLAMTDVDLARVVGEVAEELDALAASRNVTIEVDSASGPPLHADELRLRQVVENLVTNALKYGMEGTVVRIAARCDGTAWTISVEDEGPGISAEEALLIFEPYYRAPKREQAQPGTGLGLAIVRGLVELHGGSVTVERPGEPGARLVCRLPVDGGEAGIK